MNPYESIKSFILKGTFKPGERLTEENLATRLNVSRTPIREAIKQLEIEGLITPLKRGMMVKTFTREDIRQIYDLRALLEGHAASQAATFRTEEDIIRLKEANEPFINLFQSYKNPNWVMNNKLMETNQVFHDAVCLASKNEHIRSMISKVVVVPLVFRAFYWYNFDQLKLSVKAHETIIKSIADQDPERARTAMLEHVYQGRDLVLKSIETPDTEISEMLSDEVD